MKEILGKNLENLFNAKRLIGTRTYMGKEFEVWEVTDKTYKLMSNMPDAEFYKLCPLGEWYYASGSNMESPNIDYVINGQSIKAWDGEVRLNWANDECEDCSDFLEGNCSASEEDVLGCFHKRDYKSLSDYFDYELSVGMLKNICALATDLAKYNRMTVGELFSKYEG